MSYSIYSFVADAVLVLILLLGIFFGWKRGFVRTVAKPVKLVVALILAFSLCTAVGEGWIQPLLEAPIEQHLTSYLQQACADMTAQTASEELPTLLKMAAGMFDIDITEVAESGGADIIRSIVRSLTEPVAHVVAILFAFIGIYIVSRILLWIVVALIGAIFNIGILGIANRIIGVVFSLLFAVVIAWSVVSLTECIIGLSAATESVFVSGIREGFLYRFFNEYTPLDILLSF
ncbi:MAG: CvpA family protein [Clostridia bacterium]|nr:CvpA family protein [Clostridia bacterium]